MKSRIRCAVAVLAFGFSASVLGQQASLENPQPASFQSGIGLISGWSCAGNVQVVVDGTPLTVAYCTPRADVAPVCAGNGTPIIHATPKSTDAGHGGNTGKNGNTTTSTIVLPPNATPDPKGKVVKLRA